MHNPINKKWMGTGACKPWYRLPVRTFAMFSLCAVLEAQPPGRAPAPDASITIDMAHIVAMVKDRNLEVKASQEAIQTAKYKVGEAKALRFGRVGVDSFYTRLDDQIAISTAPVHFMGMTVTIPPTILAPADSLHVRLEAGVPLYTGGKITNTIAKARAGEKAVRALSGDTQAAVTLDAERSYLAVLLGRDVVRLNERALKSFQRHLADASAACRQGVVANYDVIRAETAVAEQEKRLIEARNRLELSEAAMRTTLDLSETAALDIRGILSEPPAPPLIENARAAAVAGHQGLAALRHRVDVLERAERVAKSDYQPQVVAFAGRETATSKLARTDPDWYAGVRATWTLFEGGARRARVGEQSSEMARARIELRHAEDQVKLAVRSSLLNYESQKGALQAARKAAELATESLRLATRRFAVGTGTSLEVLDANLAVTAAETSIQNSLFGMTVAYLEIHRQAGDISEVAMRIQK